MSQQSFSFQPRLDNTHTTFVNCLRNWDDPLLNGCKPLKLVGCVRCESCGCRLIQPQNIENSNINGKQHSSGTISLTCSLSEAGNCAKSDSNAQLNNNSDNTNFAIRQQHLCNAHSSLNRNLSVSNLSNRSLNVTAKPETCLRPSKCQPLVR